MGGMLDTEFEDENTLLPDDKEQLGEMREVLLPEGKDDLDIVVVDDTPDEDRGKWTADKKPTDEGEDDGALEYSRSVQKRIAKETAKVHAERRAKEERERQLQEAASVMQRILEENNQLKSLLETGEKVLVTENRGRIESQIEQAKAALREAHEAGDINGQIAAQENLAKLVAERERVATHVVNPIPRTDEKEILGRFQIQKPAVTPDDAALDWREKNPWFGNDEGMTAYAMALHHQMVTKEGISPADADRYYGRIDREMRQRFPEKFARAGTPRRTDTVVAAPGRATGGNTRKVTLTESQVKLARRLGLTPKQYAEQLIAENGKKEWTHGKS